MKNILLAIAVSATATVSNAQYITAGPEIGLNLSTFSSRYNGNAGSEGVRPGLKIGGIVDIGLTRRFSIQPGLYFTQKGSHNEDYSYASNGFVTTEQTVTQDTRINYLEVPVNFQLRFGSRRGAFFVGAGPYLAAALGGKVTNIEESSVTVGNNNGGSIDEDHYSLRIGDGPNDDIRGLDAGMNVNAGVMARGFFFRANMGLGFANILANGNDNNYIRNYGAGLTIGWLLGR